MGYRTDIVNAPPMSKGKKNLGASTQFNRTTNFSNNMMGGKGAPRSTVFGVLGQTVYDSHSRSVGGLVLNTKERAPLGKGTTEAVSQIHHNTERGLLGPASQTHIPGSHYGMKPYAGFFRSAVGPKIGMKD